MMIYEIYALRSCFAAFFCLSALALAISALSSVHVQAKITHFCFSSAALSLSFFTAALFLAASLSSCALCATFAAFRFGASRSTEGQLSADSPHTLLLLFELFVSRIQPQRLFQQLLPLCLQLYILHLGGAHALCRRVWVSGRIQRCNFVGIAFDVFVRCEQPAFLGSRNLLGGHGGEDIGSGWFGWGFSWCWSALLGWGETTGVLTLFCFFFCPGLVFEHQTFPLVYHPIQSLV
jgi:hypothetical protein